MGNATTGRSPRLIRPLLPPPRNGQRLDLLPYVGGAGVGVLVPAIILSLVLSSHFVNHDIIILHRLSNDDLRSSSNFL